MRITNNMLTRKYTNSLNSNLEALSKYQTQLASLKRITTPSDDPIGSMKSMKINAQIGKTDQYQSVVDSAKTVLTDEETAISSMNKLLTDAYEKAIEATSDSTTSADKTSIAAYIGQLRDEVLSLANSQSGDVYIFGGYNTQQPPFTVDSSGNIQYNGLDLTDDSDADLISENEQAISYEIGTGMTMEVTTPGTQLMGMGEDNIYSVLDGLYHALQDGESSDTISGYITKLQDAQSNILSLDSTVGGKINRLDLLANRYENDQLNYTSVKSKIEDVDVAQVTLQYQNMMTVYEAALSVGSKIVMPTLVDYLN